AEHVGEALARVLVVVDHDDSSRSTRHLDRVAAVRGRQTDRELGAASEPLASRLDAAAVGPAELLHEREPEAAAPGGAVERRVRLREEVEDARQHVGRDPGAVVADAEDRVCSVNSLASYIG